MPIHYRWKLPDTPTALDGFCGGGGSSEGLVKAGVRVATALNHNEISLATHALNHPTTEHDQIDITASNPYKYPRCNILWMSPECTQFTNASGKHLEDERQLTLWGELAPDPRRIRSRATMLEVVRYAEAHLPNIVIVENVVEVKAWGMYSAWWRAMLDLGYSGRELYLNAAHFGTPSRRDRFYAFFWRKTASPDLDFHPAGKCPGCDMIVKGNQTWLTARHYGKYKTSYIWTCPRCHQEMFPETVPIASILDWSLPTKAIRDRKKALAENTLNRIRWGLREYGNDGLVFSLDHTHQHAKYRVRPVSEPTMTITTSYSTMLAATPFVLSYYGRDNACSPVSAVLPTVTPGNRHSLILPPGYQDPLDEDTIEQMLPNCRTRFLEPRELAQAMGFPKHYRFVGTKDQQVSQIGHAVSVDIAELLARKAVALLA